MKCFCEVLFRSNLRSHVSPYPCQSTDSWICASVKGCCEDRFAWILFLILKIFRKFLKRKGGGWTNMYLNNFLSAGLSHRKRSLTHTHTFLLCRSLAPRTITLRCENRDDSTCLDHSCLYWTRSQTQLHTTISRTIRLQCQRMDSVICTSVKFNLHITFCEFPFGANMCGCECVCVCVCLLFCRYQ